GRGGFWRPRDPEEPLEAVEIELARPDLHRIAPRAGDDRLPPEDLAQLRDVHLQCVRGRVRRGRAPELVDQAIPGDDVGCVQEQDGKQGALLRAPKGDRAAVLERLQRAEDPELHAPLLHRPTIAAVAVPSSPPRVSCAKSPEANPSPSGGS